MMSVYKNMGPSVLCEIQVIFSKLKQAAKKSAGVNASTFTTCSRASRLTELEKRSEREDSMTSTPKLNQLPL